MKRGRTPGPNSHGDVSSQRNQNNVSVRPPVTTTTRRHPLVTRPPPKPTAAVLCRYKDLTDQSARDEETVHQLIARREGIVQLQETVLPTALEQHVDDQETRLAELRATELAKDNSSLLLQALDVEQTNASRRMVEIQEEMDEANVVTETTKEDIDSLRVAQSRIEQELRDIKQVVSRTEDDEQKQREELQDVLRRVHAEKFSTMGLSDEAASLVREEARLERSRDEYQIKAVSTEVQRRQLFSQYEELKGTIRVYCRVKGSVLESRPRSVSPAGSAARSSASSSASNTTTHSVLQGGAAKYQFPDAATEKREIVVTSYRDNATSTGRREQLVPFRFDRVFAQSASQQDVFDEVGPLVDTAVDGYRVCILAYGQTGSGKTYTMEGGGDLQSELSMGIIPRAIRQIFERREQLAKDGWSYKLTCFFVEIYNDSIRDLLETSEAYQKQWLAGPMAPPSGPKLGPTTTSSSSRMPTHDIVHRGAVDTTITGVNERVVHNMKDIQQLLDLSVRNRSVAKTQMNERSSRSHCVFTIRMEGVNESIRQRCLGNLCLVDLAGSEKVSESGVQGVQFKEAVNINRSLSFLGDCICALGSGAVVPWRNCKLTHLLQNYLGGEGAKVLMVVAVSDKQEHTSETINSLRFAHKVNQTNIGTAKKRTMHT